jgi:hypothetical protein
VAVRSKHPVEMPPGGPVEGRQQAVPGRVDIAAPVPFDLPAREMVVPGEESRPAGIADFGQPLGRADDVGEQDGRKDPVQAAPCRSPVRNASISSTTASTSPMYGA